MAVIPGAGRAPLLRKFTDLLLITAILILPLTGLLQACGGGGNPSSPDPSNQNTPPGNRAPLVVIEIQSPSEGPSPISAVIDASATTDPDGDEIEFLWLFSDGTTETGPVIDHEFASSGRHNVRLIASDKWGAVADEGPIEFEGYGLANSAWPKFAHDERNSGLSPNVGPNMNLAGASDGHAFPRYWRTWFDEDPVRSVCVTYGGNVIFASGKFVRCYTPEGGQIWTWEADSLIMTWPAVAWDGSIFLGTLNGTAWRISPDGSPIWSVSLSDTLGQDLRVLSAVNIDGTPQVLIGAEVLSPLSGLPIGAVLFSLDMDGSIKWSQVIANYPTDGELNPSMIAPAIASNGNIVVNGLQGVILTPDGSLVADLTYRQGTGSEGESLYPPLGPPSIGPDDMIVFNHVRGPVFTPDGTYQFELFGPNINMDFEGEFLTGFTQAPVWGNDGVSLVQWKYNDLLEGSRGYYLSTRTDYGGITRNLLDRALNSDFASGMYVHGAAEDRLGRLYATSLGIFALSPVSSASVYPMVTNRYSLWVYRRGKPQWSAPVIGDDGWLFVGYGNDLLAIGD